MIDIDEIIGICKSRTKQSATTPGGRIDRTKTAPQPHDEEVYRGVGVDGILAASGKLLAVNRGEANTDERDSLAFKRVMTPDKMMRERIRMDADKSANKVMRALAKKKSLKAFTPFHFDNYTSGLLVGNPLSTPLEEINPMHIAEQARRITLMGPGGIGSPRAITPGMQAVHASQFGFLDPLAGPESERAGIDSRLSWGVRVGSDGRLYQRFRNRKTGEVDWVSPDALEGKTVKLPD